VHDRGETDVYERTPPLPHSDEGEHSHGDAHIRALPVSLAEGIVVQRGEDGDEPEREYLNGEGKELRGRRGAARKRGGRKGRGAGEKGKDRRKK
jgi:hypothetical protein